MTSGPDEKEKDGNNVPAENLLRITDELVRQVDRTKRLVVIMIVAVVVAIPVAWHVAPLVSGSQGSFRAIGYVTIVVALVFLAVGIRQWMVLSKWTKRYRKYKLLQEKVDKRLDFESEESLTRD